MYIYKIGLSNDYEPTASTTLIIPFDNVTIGPHESETHIDAYNTNTYTFTPTPTFDLKSTTFLVIASIQFNDISWTTGEIVTLKLKTASKEIEKTFTVATTGSQIVQVNIETLVMVPFGSYLKTEIFHDSLSTVALNKDKCQLCIAPQKLITLDPVINDEG